MNFLEDIEKNNLYFPSSDFQGDPGDIGLEFEDVYLKTDDGVLIHGWFVPNKNSRHALLHCHGNAGNISHRLDDIQRFHKMGLNVLLFDYRGYGKSQGSPSEKGTYLDAEAAYRYLTEKKGFKEKEIVIHGQSLGGAVAIELCLKTRPAGLICESTFTSTEAVAQEIYPFLPIKWLITMKYDSLAKIGKIEIPKLFLHSEGDEIIKYHHGQKLFEAAAEPKEFFVMQGGHNEGFYVTKGYVEAIQQFVKSVLKD